MKSNFDFLPEDWQFLYSIAVKAENNIYIDPRATLTELRLLCETLTDGIFYFNRISDIGKTMTQYEKLNYLQNKSIVADDVIDYLQIIRKLGNQASHDKHIKVSSAMAMDALKKVYLLTNWFVITYINHNYQPKEFVIPIDQKQRSISINNNLKQQIIELQNQNKEFQKQLSQQQIPKIAESERNLRKKISNKFLKHHHLNEHDTRMLIDQQLKDAGWLVDTDNLNYRIHKTMPKNNEKIAIAEWPCENNRRADYALFDNLQLIGIIEAKPYDQDIPGNLEQAKEYAKTVKTFGNITLPKQIGDYKVPFIYATNGRKFIRQLKEKSGIWFWDARKPYNYAYPLTNWHSPCDLEERLKIDVQKADQKLSVNNDYPTFAARNYQIEAVKAVENRLSHNQRRMLLAMATGTGKTRTALSLIYRLLSTKRAKHILYLVDRVSLAQQTKDTFSNVKIGNMQLNKIYDVKGVHDRVDSETQVHITTIQSMIRRVLFNEDIIKRPSIGNYDFIIVDEAHRGYNEDHQMDDEELTFIDEKDYVSQYRRVLDYFDAPILGLTATPALQTTEIFGEPIYTYSYSDAVVDGYLVDYNPPYQLKTKLSEEGIQFDKNQNVTVYNTQNKKIEKAYLSDDLDFDVKDFNKKVITRPFNETIANELVKYIDPNDPEDNGKTLIFAATDSHADMVVELLKEAYQRANNPVHDDAIMKITGSLRNPEDAIRHFKNEKYPNIVVTVDLLTTGIDVPKITNLVFLRRVRSRILYDQMLGRATRLCPEIHKDSFNIYDAVHLYDDLQNISDMKPVIKNNVSLSKLLQYIKNASSDDEFRFYRKEIVAKLQRHKQLMNQSQLEKLTKLNNIGSVDTWLHKLNHMNQFNFNQQQENIEQMINIKVSHHYQYISNEKDEYLQTERGYGDHNEKPSDYIKSFTKFINENQDKIQALQIAINHPKDLTHDDLNEILRELERHGYNNKSLQSAWKKTKNQDIVTDIISFIRQVAKGIPLEDKVVRIHRAMQQVYELKDWTVTQRKWLKRIENQLIVNSAPILGPNAQSAFNNGIFKEYGGYERMKNIFKDQVNNIIIIINQALYQTE